MRYLYTMKTKIGLLIDIFFATIGLAQNKLPFQLFDKNGKKTSYEKLVKATIKSNVVLFGEYHNNSISHWLELELAKDISEKKAVILGAEMFEADNQKQVNEYLKGEINQKKLDSTARLWPNYKTDYKQLLDFAKANNIAFVARSLLF